MTLKYTKDEIEVMLKSANSNVVIDALMYLCFNISDLEWIQEKCIHAAKYGINEDVKGLGITCIGHIARMHSTVNREKIIPLLQNLLKDSCLAGRAQDALDDIDTFVK